MLVKNFNNLIGYAFNTSYTNLPDSQKAHMIDGTYNFIASDYWANGISDWTGAGRPSNGVSLLLSTSIRADGIETYKFEDIYFDYVLSENSKSKQSRDVGVIYTRSIIPNSNALIKSVGLLCSNGGESMLIGFENLAEPVQLTAGEPHTFSFAIKVSN